ncbi:hypothetical protein [Alteromonas sp. 14N.309.X.WAT.G.H12]|uniref:hypothetical protein n=1 Tax=Alteromonas sp. 14N.309.X.WAT.G.H12 TaxID=3120824 RepID=UPI002FD21FF3
MKNWEDLTLLQKAIFGVAIVGVALLAPEIAMLVQFGGIEIAFAFLAMYLMPMIRHINNAYSKLNESIKIAVISIQNSASAKPKVFAVQAMFCCTAFLFTGSVAFATIFFMPGLVLNGVVI